MRDRHRLCSLLKVIRMPLSPALPQTHCKEAGELSPSLAVLLPLTLLLSPVHSITTELLGFLTLGIFFGLNKDRQS
jgi:hypothetical protein